MKQINKNSVIVAHPMQQHSYRLAEALEKKGLLHSYITTVYYQEDKLVYRILNKILDSDNLKRMKNRRNPLFDHKVITYSELLGIMYLFILRVDTKKYILPYIERSIRKKYGRKVAKYAIANKIKAVVVYDKWGSYCVEYLKKYSDIITIMDMSSITSDSILEIANKDIEINDYKKDNQRNNPYKVILRPYKQSFLNEYRNEIMNCDYFLAPSNFSKGTVLKAINDSNKVFVCPYGVDTSRFKPKKNYNNDQKKIKFLYVGRLSAAKGIFYLLEAFKELSNDNVELICVGNKVGSEDLFAPYEGYYTYLGTKLNSEMNEIYTNSDVYIMPSLWEGMSLTLGEAMASGLPVIATYNTGADTLINEGENGFLIEPMNVSAIKEKVQWFLTNQHKISTMGQKARTTIQQRTWDNYYKNVSHIIEKIVNK